MSEAKFITRTPDGKEQLNGSFMGMYLIKKTRISVGVYTTVYRISSDAGCVAFRSVDTAKWLSCSPGRFDYPLDYSVRLSTGTSYTSGEVDVYEFARYSTLDAASYKGPIRFNLYLPDGSLSFAGALKPLRVPYVLSGQLTLNSSSAHMNGGYDKTLAINPDREYAIIFSPFQPCFNSVKRGGDMGVFEVVARFSDDNSAFMTKQYRHYFGKSDSGYGFSANTSGSLYCTHLIVDVTNY